MMMVTGASANITYGCSQVKKIFKKSIEFRKDQDMEGWLNEKIGLEVKIVRRIFTGGEDGLLVVTNSNYSHQPLSPRSLSQISESHVVKNSLMRLIGYRPM